MPNAQGAFFSEYLEQRIRNDLHATGYLQDRSEHGAQTDQYGNGLQGIGIAECPSEKCIECPWIMEKGIPDTRPMKQQNSVKT